MYSTIFLTHKISVILFLLVYLIKTILLLTNNKTALDKFSKVVKVPEMIISTLFLLTGIYMITQVPAITTLLIIKIVLVIASIPVAIIGFKKSNKAMAALSLFMIIMSYGLAEMHKKSAIKKVDATVVDGKEIYMANCTLCHGTDGKLAASGAKDLSGTELSKEEMVAIITNGKGAMMPYGSSLSKEQINAVADYAATLKK